MKTVRDSRTKKAFVAVDSSTSKPVRVGFHRQPVFNGAIETTTATLPKLPKDLSLDLVTTTQDITELPRPTCTTGQISRRRRG